MDLVGEFVRNILSVTRNTRQPPILDILDYLDQSKEERTYPVIFSNMLRAPSVIFSFVLRILEGSTFPWPNFFSAKSRPVYSQSCVKSNEEGYRHTLVEVVLVLDIALLLLLVGIHCKR